MKVTAVPQLVDPIKHLLDNPQKNERQYGVYKSVVATKKLQPLDAPYQDAELYKKGTSYFVLDHARQRVAYFMKYDIRTLQGHKAAYQIIVWSDPSIVDIRGYASTVFFEQLFDEADAVTTDRHQTPAGGRFWLNVISMAFRSHLYVYYMNRNTKHVVQLKNQQDVDAHRENIWTAMEKGTGNLVVISKDPLKATA